MTTDTQTDWRGVGPPADLCWFHGVEPITGEEFTICGECGHAWTREALEAADAEHYPDMRPRTAEHIYSCPLCVHDF